MLFIVPIDSCLAWSYKEADEKPTMCFLKDSWQEISSRTSREAVIYRMLEKESVERVANILLGGDVRGLESETLECYRALSLKHLQ